MSVLNSLKDVCVGQAVKLAGSPRLTKLAGDPRLVNAAMKAMSLGGTVKVNVDKAGRLAAGVLGLATQDEMAGLRSTIQTLEDQVASLEARHAATVKAASEAASPKPVAKTGRS